jgi:hypothetical protein
MSVDLRLTKYMATSVELEIGLHKVAYALKRQCPGISLSVFSPNNFS